jgi:rhodanese-related sulfurtransferase
METRKKISVILIMTGVLLAFLPLTSNRSFMVSPEKLLSDILSVESSFNTDMVARFLVNDDSTVRLIDLRSPEEFRNLSIPGSVNVPYNEFVKSDLYIYLDDKNIRNIFYSNDDIFSGYALAYARGLGYKNCYLMKGGLNDWFETVMNSKFEKGRITARENALFETRTKASKLFNEFNSLPDSLKIQFMASNKFSTRKLDGGCE